MATAIAYGSITISDLTDGVAYYVESSVQAILQNASTQSELVDSNGNNIIDSNGNLIVVQGSSFLPSSITFYAKTRTGKASPTAYNGRFLIEESEDGVTWTTHYTSSTDESEHDYTPVSEDSRFIRCTLFEAGGEGVSLHSQTIAVINEPQTLKRIDNYYRITDSATAPTSGWSKNPSTIPSPTELLPYLWTYQEQYYSDGSVVTVRPTIIAKYGCTIRSIETWYIQKTDGVTPELDDPDWRTYLVAYVRGKSFWSKQRYYYDDTSGQTGLYFEADPVLEDDRDYAVEQNDAARDMANEYNEIILATNQHFWWDTNGIHVSEQPQREYDISPSGPNMLQNSDGILLRDGNTTLSQFSGSGVQIGNVSKNHSIYDANGAYWYEPDEQSPFMKIEFGTLSDSNSIWDQVVITEKTDGEAPDNPHELGWYEKINGDEMSSSDSYILSSDTTVNPSKTYYMQSYWNYWDMPSGRVRWGNQNQYLVFNDHGLSIKADSITFGPSEETLSNAIDGLNTMINSAQVSFDNAITNVNKRIDGVSGLSGFDAEVIYSDPDDTSFNQSIFFNAINNDEFDVLFGQYIFLYNNGWQLLFNNVDSHNLLLQNYIVTYDDLATDEILDTSDYIRSGELIYTRNASSNKGFYISNHTATKPDMDYTIRFRLEQDESSASDITTFYLFSQDPDNIITSELFINGVSQGAAVNISYPIDFSPAEPLPYETRSYKISERALYQNKVYESLIDGNLSSPGSSTDDWVIVTKDPIDVIINFHTESTIQTGTYVGLILQLNKQLNNSFTAKLSSLEWFEGNEISTWTPPPIMLDDNIELSIYGLSTESSEHLDAIIVSADGVYDSPSDISTLAQNVYDISQQADEMERSFNDTITSTRQEINDGINTSISNVITTVRQSTSNQLQTFLGEINNTLEPLSQFSSFINIDGSMDWFNALYTGISIDQGGLHVHGIDTIFDDSESGYHLARTDVEVGIAPDRISFKKGGQTVAWVGDKNTGVEDSYKLRIQEADVIKEVRIGDLGFIPRSNGNMCLKFVGGDDQLGWYINAGSFSSQNLGTGKCYFYGYDVEGKAADINGYVYVDSKRVVIQKGCWVSVGDGDIPYGIRAYVVYNQSSNLFYSVWHEDDAWYGIQYTSSGTPSSPAVYSWNTENIYDDVILAHFELSSANSVVYDGLVMPDNTYVVIPGNVQIGTEDVRIGMRKITPDGAYIDNTKSKLYSPALTYNDIAE